VDVKHPFPAFAETFGERGRTNFPHLIEEQAPIAGALCEFLGRSVPAADVFRDWTHVYRLPEGRDPKRASVPLSNACVRFRSFLLPMVGVGNVALSLIGPRPFTESNLIQQCSHRDWWRAHMCAARPHRAAHVPGDFQQLLYHLTFRYARLRRPHWRSLSMQWFQQSSLNATVNGTSSVMKVFGNRLTYPDRLGSH